jgi:O-antigen/teichoic acid export membrane protein
MSRQPPAPERTETERELLGMARGGGLNLAGSTGKHVALLGVTLLLAHQLGRADVGRYAQAIALLAVLETLSLSGVFAALRRFVAVHVADRDHGALRGTVRLGLGLSTASSVVLGAGLFLAAPWLAEDVLRDAALLSPLRFVALALPFATYTEAALAATQGFRTMRPSAYVGLLLEPGLRLALTGLLLPAMGLTGAMVALLAGYATAAVLAAVALLRLLGPGRQKPRYRPRELLGFSTVNWMSTLASTGLLWVDTLLLGMFLSSEDVGLYNVATRLITMATFVMPAVNSAFAPRIADLHHRGRAESLARVYAVAAGWNVRLTVPIFAVLLAFPAELLSLFGKGFAAAAAVTVTLAIGKFIVAATGPCGLMLDMSGRPAWSMANNLAGLVLNVLLNLWWIPEYGIVGSAVAWALSLTLVNLARVLEVWRIMGMLPFDLASLKGVAAGAGATVVGLLVNRWLGRPLDLVVGIPALGLTYLGLLLALGISAEDRLVLGLLTRRVRPAGPPAPRVAAAGRTDLASDAGAHAGVPDADR